MSRTLTAEDEQARHCEALCEQLMVVAEEAASSHAKSWSSKAHRSTRGAVALRDAALAHSAIAEAMRRGQHAGAAP